MVHPVVKGVAEGAPLPAALTPVYPTSAQLPQAYLRKAVVSALGARRWPRCCRRACAAGRPAVAARGAAAAAPPAAGRPPLAALEDRSHPAWQRLKFEELLAQQLSQLQAQAERARLRAPALAPRAGACATGCWACCPSR
jgi:ATP-dependent DNA helicase RecG